jgi:hypothetical protein
MSRAEAAPADRLPWLPDEPRPQPVRRRGNALLLLAAIAILLVAGVGFWLGTRSVEEQPKLTSRGARPSMTVPLPALRTVQPPEVRLPAQPEVAPAPAPQVRSAPVREVRITAPPAVHAAQKPDTSTEEATVAAEPAAPKTVPQPFVLPKPWNPRLVDGAAGRLVQVGAFGSTLQAKKGWWYMVRAYPAVAHLPAVVRTSRNSRGRNFYRFQVGTTSQAHSEVLCQRMERIHFSCAVVGLPWKAKVER